MIKIKDYIRAGSLEEAYELNQKRSACILGGMLWTKMGERQVQTAIDLSGLGLDQIEESEEEFSIGCMVTLRQMEEHEGLNAYTDGAARESVRSIVGVQFRNLATVGGSIFGRFGFSDVLTLFLALGMLGAWVSCFLTGYAGPSAIFQSMLFAYTWLWPDQMGLLFGIIPFKMKYLGWIELAFWAFSFLTGSFAIKVSLVLGLAGFLAFYGREVFDWCVDAVKDWKRRRDWENRNR